jgi:hypothetical protein
LTNSCPTVASRSYAPVQTALPKLKGQAMQA